MAEQKNIPQLSTAGELFGKSYAIVRRNLNTYALVYAIPAAMMIAGVAQMIDKNRKGGWEWGDAFSSSILGPSLGSDSSFDSASAILVLFLLLGTVASSFLAIVLNFRASQGKAVTFSAVWRELWGNWLWARLLGLGVLAAFIIVLGFFLLIVPGVILLWRLYLAPWILLDKNVKIMDALSESWNMTKGYAWPIYSILVFSIVLSLPNAIPIVGGIIAFLLGVSYAAAPALRYQEIKKLA